MIVNELQGKGNKLKVDSSLTPDQLNSFYCTIATSVTRKLTGKFEPFLRHGNVRESFFFRPTTVYELRDVFLSIDENKAPGWDGMGLKIFKCLPENVMSILVDVINQSFTLGIFPDSLKVANVAPIYKGGDQKNPTNYRPVALLPTLSKIIEKIARTRMDDFLEKHGVLKAAQFGFQRNKGTNDAIFSFLESLYMTANDRDAAAAVFCDLSKAFDSVNHQILLHKLEYYGFRGTSLGWFHSYLSGRVQMVTLGDKKSKLGELCCGVPQGSVLGPILFLIYVNDLADLPIAGRFTIFADDATILWRGKDVGDVGNLTQTINSDLKIIRNWCDGNKLCFNVSKTNVMSFKCNLEEINLNNVVLKNHTENKFLGLYIDKKLQFDFHIRQLSKKLSSNCWAMRVLSKNLHRGIVRNAYFALIESHLRYGISFWGVCSGHLFQTIFVLQKRALRYLCKVGARESCKPLFKREKILTLPSLFI